jgi:hypothetical protein
MPLLSNRANKKRILSWWTLAALRKPQDLGYEDQSQVGKLQQLDSVACLVDFYQNLDRTTNAEVPLWTRMRHVVFVARSEKSSDDRLQMRMWPWQAVQRRKTRRLEGLLDVLEEQSEKLPRRPLKIPARPRRKREENVIGNKRKKLKLGEGKRKRPEERLDARQKLRKKPSVALLRPRRLSALKGDEHGERELREKARRTVRLSQRIQRVWGDQIAAGRMRMQPLLRRKPVAGDEKNVALCASLRRQGVVVERQRLW